MLVVLMLVTTGLSYSQSNKLRTAFPLDSLKDVSPSDVKVAANFLLRDIVRSQGYQSEISTPETHKELMKDIFEDRYDAFVIFTYQYLKYRDHYDMIPQVVTSHEGSDPKQSLLLVAPPGKTLESLKGGILLIQSGSGELVDIWIQNELRKNGLDPNTHFSSIEIKSNVSKALLPVFFGKAQAAVCMGKSFALMKELNPQIGKRLHVVTKTDPLTSTMLCLRGGFVEKTPGTIRRTALNLHNSSQGKQLLTIMGVERFTPYRPDDLAGVEKLINESLSLQAADSPAPNDPIEVKLK